MSTFVRTFNLILLVDFQYGCVLYITVPVQSVHLLSRDSAGSHIQSYIKDERVEFSDGEIRQVICLVNGSHPAPSARVFVDDVDITDQFTETTDVVTVGPPVTKGLQVDTLDFTERYT